MASLPVRRLACVARAHRYARVVSCVRMTPQRQVVPCVRACGGAPHGSSGAVRGFATADDGADASVLEDLGELLDDAEEGAEGGSAASEASADMLDRTNKTFPPIRNDPLHGEFGLMKDVLEHEYWCDKQRERLPGGWPMLFNPTEEDVQRAIAMTEEQVKSGSVTAGDQPFLVEDPWINGYLTEDEIMFHEEYEVQPYMSGKIKDQMYYLFCHEGWDIARLSQRFGVRSERVGMILNMKRTEPDMKATGRFDPRVDELFAEMYGGRFNDFVEQGESNDKGINMAVLKDEQLPDDVLPRWKVPPSASQLHYRLPKVPVPPREERTFKSKYVIKDVNVKKADALRVVDFDGTVRASTQREAAARSWRKQSWSIRPDAKDDLLDFNPISTANPGGLNGASAGLEQ